MRLFLTLICQVLLANAAYAIEFSLESTGRAPLYQSTLTKEVYQYSRREHLNDLAVKNADDESIPYALIPYASIHAKTKVTEVSKPLVIFPMQEKALKQAGVMRVQLSDQSSNTSLNVTSGAPDTIIRNFYLFDLGEQHKAFKKLTLDWHGEEGRLITVAVKTSDNLKDWTDVGEATLLKISTGDQLVVQNSILLDRMVEARYLQIYPMEQSETFHLKAADIEFNDVEALPQPILWQPLSRWDRVVDHAQINIDYEASGRYPAEFISIKLPQINTITYVSVLSRNHQDDPWKHVTAASLYRLSKQGKEYANQDISIQTTTARYWRLVFNQASGGIGKDDPVLSVGWLPEILVWNARGQQPYHLEVGVDNNVVNIVPITSLVQGYNTEKVNRLPVSEISIGSHQPQQAGNAWDMETDYKRLWLWGGLFLGVFALAAMAYSLIKNNPKT